MLSLLWVLAKYSLLHCSKTSLMHYSLQLLKLALYELIAAWFALDLIRK